MTSLHLDERLLYSDLAADPDLGEIVDLFVTEMPEKIAAMRADFSAGSWESLRRTAHQLKGAAGSYGFADVSPSAAALEAAVRTSAPERRIGEALDALAELCHRLRPGPPPRAA
jgi:HPt (histidine-containing phosphotransfer) domain-containing protein